jgi:CheY-like chemotaxis protein/anti-sigma regulatory factor (Ser/Thr protein kinase)
MTYFAKHETDEARRVEFIEKIETSSDLLLGVVNDILDFSKMQGNKFSLKPENFNLCDIRKILRDLFSVKAQQKGLEFDILFDCPEIFFVYGDQFRLTQVFMNLVSNAIKFTDEGSVIVSLNHEEVGDEVILRSTVRDTGCGLSEEDIARLFTDFEQFGEVLVKSHEGTGLGLAITKRLVELMHGVVWVDSTLGRGSSFHFVVVLNRPEPSFVQTFPDGLPRIARRSGRVLVVEDSDINAEIAATMLGELGFTVDRAADGIEAIELCRDRSPDYYDLVLMDIHMPRMNGYDTARALKTEHSLSCPILAVTATSEEPDVLESNREYISGAIMKPYKPGVFRVLFDPAVS